MLWHEHHKSYSERKTWTWPIRTFSTFDETPPAQPLHSPLPSLDTRTPTRDTLSCMWEHYHHCICAIIRNSQERRNWVFLGKPPWTLSLFIKCSDGNYLTLFQLGRVTFITATVYHVTKPSWSRVDLWSKNWPF